MAAPSTPAPAVFSAHDGRRTFTVTATSAGVTGTASFTVTAPPFLNTITVSPANASVQVGAKQPFTAAGQDQFGQPFSLGRSSPGPCPAAAHIDPGTGVFSATTVGGPFTVTATSGGVSGTAKVTVTSVPQDFSLSVNPTAQSVRRGGTATYTVTIAPSNAPVTLSLTGQPSGSTVTFSPITNGTSTLTIKTRQTTSRGTFAMTIKGVSGSFTHTIGVSLTVTK